MSAISSPPPPYGPGPTKPAFVLDQKAMFIILVGLACAYFAYGEYKASQVKPDGFDIRVRDPFVVPPPHSRPLFDCNPSCPTPNPNTACECRCGRCGCATDPRRVSTPRRDLVPSAQK